MWWIRGNHGIMDQLHPKSLYAALERVPDVRQYNTVHPLVSVLALCVCAMLCGARSKFAIAQWGRDNADEVVDLLGFRRSRTPCHATIHNVLKAIDIAAFEAEMTSWARQFLPRGKRTACAIDGKKLRGIHGETLPGVHLIALLSHELGLPLAQIGAADKEGELTGARQLLEALSLRGLIITGDALYCQRDLCEHIAKKKDITSFL